MVVGGEGEHAAESAGRCSRLSESDKDKLGIETSRRLDQILSKEVTSVVSIVNRVSEQQWKVYNKSWNLSNESRSTLTCYLPF